MAIRASTIACAAAALAIGGAAHASLLPGPEYSVAATSTDIDYGGTSYGTYVPGVFPNPASLSVNFPYANLQSEMGIDVISPSKISVHTYSGGTFLGYGGPGTFNTYYSHVGSDLSLPFIITGTDKASVPLDVVGTLEASTSIANHNADSSDIGSTVAGTLINVDNWWMQPIYSVEKTAASYSYQSAWTQYPTSYLDSINATLNVGADPLTDLGSHAGFHWLTIDNGALSDWLLSGNSGSAYSTVDITISIDPTFLLENPNTEILYVSNLPEVGTWAMLILGVAMIGIAARRRNAGLARAA